MKTWVIIVTIALILIGLHFWRIKRQREMFNGYTRKEIIRELAKSFVNEWNENKVLEMQESGEITKTMAKKSMSEAEATKYLLKFYQDNQVKEITIDWLPFALFDLGLDAKEEPRLLDLYVDVKKSIKF